MSQTTRRAGAYRWLSNTGLRNPFPDEAEILICSVARTPFGSFQGSLSHLSATDLGSIAIKACIDRCNLPPEAVSESFIGNVCSANLGQAPARQAALKAGLSIHADATAIDKVCSSGLKAIALGAQSIALGLNSVVVAGGMESMSNVPYYDTAARKGARLGHATLVDGMLQDGLWDATYQIHMGDCAGKVFYFLLFFYFSIVNHHCLLISFLTH
jgi:acetyl-CoA C-acetyltransferase